MEYPNIIMAFCIEHPRRAVAFNLAAVKPCSAAETRACSGEITPVDRYMLWRRSSFIIASLALSICAAIELREISLVSENAVQNLGCAGLAVACFLGFLYWEKYEELLIHLECGIWILFFLLSMWPILFSNADLLAWINTLPALLTVPFCLHRTTVRLLLLEPDAFHTMLTLLLILPIPSVIFSGGMFGTLVQVFYGNGVDTAMPLLVVASVVMILAPTVYIFNRNSFVPRLKMDDIAKGELIYLGTVVFGVFLVVAWALRAKPFPTRNVFKFLFQVCGRTILTNVILCPMF